MFKSDIESIFDLPDSAFVDAIFHLILDRAPDLNGMQYYMNRLNEGVHRYEVFCQIFNSKECKQKKKSKKIGEICKISKYMRIPIIGKFWKNKYSKNNIKNDTYMYSENKNISSDFEITSHYPLSSTFLADSNMIKEKLTKLSIFDSKFYSRYYLNNENHIEPFEHFIKYGVLKNFNPSKIFDMEYYLRSNVDCHIKRLNPIEHYLLYGLHQGICTTDNNANIVKNNGNIVFYLKNLDSSILNKNILTILKIYKKLGYQITVISNYSGILANLFNKYAHTLSLHTEFYSLKTYVKSHLEFIKFFIGNNTNILYSFNELDLNILAELDNGYEFKHIIYFDDSMEMYWLYKIHNDVTNFLVENDELRNKLLEISEDNNSKIFVVPFNQIISKFLINTYFKTIHEKIDTINQKESPEASWYKNNLYINNKKSLYQSLFKRISIEESYIQLFKELIRSKKIVSFDPFGTLLESTHESPHAIFSYMELKAQLEKNIYCEFKNIRIESELRARKNAERKEITLNDIYITMKIDFNLSKEVINYFYQLEIQIDKQVFKTKPFGKKLYEIAIKEKKKIIYVTDMYLSKETIRDFLIDNNYIVDNELLFVSCEENATKHTGKLFEKIKVKHNIILSQWLHIGDNLYGDVYIPESMGIASYYVKNSQKNLREKYCELNTYNYKSIEDELFSSSIFGIIASKYYGNNRINDNDSYGGDAYRIGYETLGVVLLGFLKYLHKNISDREYEKIFFVSRDGYYMKIIYDILKKYNPEMPPSSYLMSSRVLASSASITDESSLLYIANKDYFPTSLQHILQIRFNFDENMFSISKKNLLKFGFTSFEDRVSKNVNHDGLLAFLNYHQSMIIEKNRNNRLIFQEYLEKIAIDEKSLIVDIGYAGSLQQTLLSITNRSIDGLYFIVNEKIKELQHSKLNYKSYIGYEDKKVGRFFKYVQLFELFLSSTHPSIIGIQKENNHFKPKFDTAGFSEKTNRMLSSLHQGAVSFIEDYFTNHIDLFLGIESFDSDIALTNLFSFFENPDISDCMLFSEIVFEDNFGANKYQLITNELDKLCLSDEALSGYGVWVEASRKLINMNIFKDITSSKKNIDRFKDDGSLEPCFLKDDNVIQINDSFIHIKIIVNIQEEYVIPFLESIKNQFYPFYKVVFYFEKDISQELKEQIIYTENAIFKIGKYVKPQIKNNNWVVFVDNGIIFEPNFLIEIYNHIINHDCDFIYFDEDDFLDNEYKNPKFKPDFSPELMLSQPYYLGNVIAIKEQYLLANTNMNLIISETGFESILSDFKVDHIPKILYHNMSIKTDVCYKELIEVYLHKQNIKYLEVFLEEYSITERKPVYSIKFPDYGPDIAIIIPTKNKLDVLKICLDSLEMTTYKNYKVYIIDNDSDEKNILNYFKSTQHKVLKISSPNGIFNYSYINNEAAKMVDENYLLFLNNDVKIITKDWLSQMVGLIQIQDIGQVGARLFYEDGLLQHVGITNHIGTYGLPAPSFKLINGNSTGYLHYAKSIKNFAAMSAACMLTRKTVFFSMGGFDETNFSVAYNDCDYGFKLIQHGYRNVVASNAELYHYEGRTRGIGIGNDNPSEEASFIRKYKNWIDPYYNPNLTRVYTDFSIRNTIVRTLPNQKFRCLFISHNFEYEGAPLILLEIAKGLKSKYNLDIVVISPVDGALREVYKENGIDTHVLYDFNLFSSNTFSDYEQSLSMIKTKINQLGVDIICANTVLTYWGIEIADKLNIPSLWIIHESEPPFEHLRNHNKLIEARGKACLNYSYKNIFVSHYTRELYEPFNVKNNFEVILNGFDSSRVTNKIDESIRLKMRKQLGIEDKFVFICPGIVSKRKSQIDAIKAFELLANVIKPHIVILILGDRESAYSNEMHIYHKQSDMITYQNIKIIAETKEIEKYYNASDAFLFTSHLESFPKVVQEAMYLKLPIVSTNTFGIKEQVSHNSSALLCDIGDIHSLSVNLQKVFQDIDLRNKLVLNALSAFDKLPNYEDMIEQYNELFQQAYFFTKNQ
jgi:predicted HAD superfamily hydrolase/glycosyltransferase involved in cell wall biosynthesis/GT2 family glycosyltransferase